MKPRTTLSFISTSENSYKIQTSSNSTKILPNYTNDIQETFKPLNDKKILQITKFMNYIKNILTQTKKLQDPM